MRKKAFNLAEILLVLAIIGTISILSLQVIRKSNDDYRRMYYTAYNTLVQAAGNAALEWNPTCSCSDFENRSDDMLLGTCWADACWKHFEYKNGTAGNSVNLGVRRDYPGFLMGSYTKGSFTGYATDSNFCKTLTSKLNTINETIECQYFINAYALNNKSNQRIDYSKGNEFLDTFCSKQMTKPSEYTNETINKCETEIQPSFITANGQRFYISKLLSTNANLQRYPDTNGNPKINREFFRLVAVDLNGINGPNTQLTRASGKLPDIVLFAIRSDGTVVPLGLPEINRNYAGAIVQYPEFLRKIDSATGTIERNTTTQSGSTTIFAAKALAWGFETGKGIDINTDTAYGQVFSEMEPLSYSTLLYQMSSLCRPIEAGGSGSSSTCPTNRYTDELLARLVTQFLYNKKGSSETIPLNSEPDADTDHGCTYRYSRCNVKVLEPTK